MNNYNYFNAFNNNFLGRQINYELNTYNNVDKPNNLYGAYEGYIKGNLFKDLYSQYKNYNPQQIVPQNEQEELLFNLNQIQFAMHELNLYLDNYPNDRNTLNTFMTYKNMYNNLLNEYENKYEPIIINGVNDNNTPFTWENSPSPWDWRY